MNQIKQESLFQIFEEKQKNWEYSRNSILLSDTSKDMNCIVKAEIRWLLDNTEDEIFIIDKYGEFSCFYEDERTTLYKLSMTDWCINPLEMNLTEMLNNTISYDTYYHDKLEFLFAFVEQIAGPMTEKRCSVIDKAFYNIYTDFKEKRISETPMIHDLLLQLVDEYKTMGEYTKKVSKALIDKLKVVEDIPLLNNQTTAKHKTRITIFDVSELGPFEDIGTLCCLEYINQVSKEFRFIRKTASIFVQNVEMLKKKENEKTFSYILGLWKRSRMSTRSINFAFDYKSEYTPGIENESIRIESYDNIRTLLNDTNWITILNPNEQDKGHGDKRILDMCIWDYEHTYFEFGKKFSDWLKLSTISSKACKPLLGLVMTPHQVCYFNYIGKLI